MSFRDQLKARRVACGLTRASLAEQLGVSASAVGNYETGVSFPKEDVLLRLFDALRTDPNQLFCGSYRSGGFDLSGAERTLLEKYRSLSPIGRDTVRSVTDALCDYRDELTEERGGKREPRLIHVYEFKMLDFALPRVSFRLRCTKGTYVRTICHDVGERLGVGAHLEQLRRTESGGFTVAQAITLDALLQRETLQLVDVVIPMHAFAGAAPEG